MTEKGELHTEIGGSATPPMISGSVSYAFTDKYAGQIFSRVSSNMGVYSQVSLGRYYSVSEKAVFEIYPGIGYGTSGSYRLAGFNINSGKYTNTFLQFNYGINKREAIEHSYGLALKSGFLMSSFEKCHETISEERDYHDIYVEPSIFYKIGGQSLKVSIKLGTLIMYNLNYKKEFRGEGLVNLGIGLHYRFN